MSCANSRTPEGRTSERTKIGHVAIRIQDVFASVEAGVDVVVEVDVVGVVEPAK